MADQPAPMSEIPLPPPKKSSLPMILIIVCVVGVGGIMICGVLGALLIPAILKATRSAKEMSCGHNLDQLRQIQQIYVTQFGADREGPAPTGGEFWLRLSRSSPPLIDPSSREIYECPLEGRPGSPSSTDYRGPSGDIDTYPGEFPVGADKVGNHGAGRGGNVLFMNGAVILVTEGDPRWQQAGQTTAP